MGKSFANNGFTLIEVLASITILSIIFLSFIAVFTNTFAFNDRNSDNIQGTSEARETQAILKENSRYREAVTAFITNVRNQENNRFSRQNEDYEELGLQEDISVTEMNGDTYYRMTFELENQPVYAYIRKTPDYEAESSSRVLYRLYAEVVEDGETVSDTYTYFEYEGEEE